MRKIITYALILAFISVPFIASAQGLVGGLSPECDKGDCQFKDIITLVNRIIQFIFYISIPIATILFSYAGFLVLTAGPDSGKAKKGKEVFMNVAIGFCIILAAWLIVYTITSALIEPNFFPAGLNPFGN